MKEVLEYLDKIGIDPFKRIESSKGGDWSVLGILKDFKSEFNFIDSCEQLKEKEAPTLEVDLNNKQAQEYRCEQMEKILKAPCKVYLFKDGKYIEL
jgi:hypothetical protein